MNRRAMKGSNPRSGFSLTELAVVISVLAILVGALVPRVQARLSLRRDERRLMDVQTLVQAIERYRADVGELPYPDGTPAHGGWDVSHDGNFISALRRGGYLDQDVVDPLNDDAYHYRYFVYEAGTYGCPGSGPYYVIGIRNFETASVAAQRRGSFRCSERDWSEEFAYVTGG